MSAVSPYLKQMLDMTGEEDHTVLDLPDTDHEVVAALLDIVYNGSIEASLEMIRKLLTLAHSLYISVPVSDQLMSMLGLQLPPQQKLRPGPSKPQGVEFPVSGLQAMSVWQLLELLLLRPRDLLHLPPLRPLQPPRPRPAR